MHKDNSPGWFDRHQIALLRLMMVAVFVIVILGGIFLSWRMTTLNQRASDNAKAVSLLSQSLDNSRQQLTQAGITPSAPPAKTIVEEVKGSPGPAGAQGVQGDPGPSGPPGPTGSTGVQGKQGQQGAEGSPGAVGPTGAPGVSGSDGKDGTNGKDGATGPAGPAGPAGPQGVAGPQGPQGAAGTMPDTVTFKHGDGTVDTCSRDSGSNSSYTCTTSAGTPPTSPTPTGSPSASGTSLSAAGLLGMVSTAGYRRRLGN